MQPNKNLMPLLWDSGKKDRPGCLLPICISFFLGGTTCLDCWVSKPCVPSEHTVSVGTEPETWTLPTQMAKSSSSPCLPHVTSPNYGSFHMTSVCSGGSHFFFRQRQVNTLSSSEAWGRRMRNSGVIWIPRSRGGVSQPQKSFSLMLTHKASLRDLSIKLQHAMQKN